MFAPVSHFQSTCTQPVGNFDADRVHAKPSTLPAASRGQTDQPRNPPTTRWPQVPSFKISCRLVTVCATSTVSPFDISFVHIHVNFNLRNSNIRVEQITRPVRLNLKSLQRLHVILPFELRAVFFSCEYSVHFSGK